MPILSISSDIISHDFSIMFIAFNSTNPFPDFLKTTNKSYPNNVDQYVENDLFFNFMKFEDTVYESGKAVSFSLQITDSEDAFDNIKQSEENSNEHIGDFNIKNHDYDTFQIAEDYEFSADESNIVKIDSPSQRDFINVSVYADKKEEANSVTVIVLY